MLKQCRKCLVFKTRNKVNFQKVSKRRSLDGYLHQCKVCLAEYQRAWKEANADYVKARDKAYYLNHREALIETRRKWRQTERGLALQRAADARSYRWKKMSQESRV